MQNIFVASVSVWLAVSTALARDIVDPELCISMTQMLGFVDKSDGRFREEGTVEGDLDEVEMLPLLDAAFARPSSILICADKEFVHSVKLTLKVHEPEFTKDPSNINMASEI